jgi:hypothetical protein
MDHMSFLQQRSLPITLKRLAPAIRGIGFLYSEESLLVFHVFETTNLQRSIKNEVRDKIAFSLAHDMNARIGWIECPEVTRVHKLRQLRSMVQNHPDMMTEAA